MTRFSGTNINTQYDLEQSPLHGTLYTAVFASIGGLPKDCYKYKGNSHQTLWPSLSNKLLNCI